MRYEAAAVYGCTCANGASRTDPRSCSFTAGRRTTFAGRGNTRARSPTSSDSSPTTSVVTACPRRRSSPSTTPTETLWADDVAAIIDELRLDRTVLVGWSYGTFVICDYVRAHGQDRIAALNFVEGAVKLGEAAFGTLIGPGFLDHFFRRYRGRPAHEHPGHALLRTGVHREASARRRPRDRGVLERHRAGLDPRQSGGPRGRLRRRARHTRGAAYSSHRARQTPSCFQRWPSTSSPPARPQRPPGTKASVTSRTSRSPSASTASWPH